MQIAVFIKNTTLHSSYGGLETQNLMLCEELATRGHNVHIFSPRNEYKGNESVRLNGVNYVFVDCSYRSLAGFARFDKNNWVNKSVKYFENIHKNLLFDIVISQSSAGLGFIRKKNKFNLPVISISHGTITGEFKTRLQSLEGFKDYIKLIPDCGYFLLNFFKRQREFIWNSDKIVAVSKAVKEALVDETFTPNEKIKVIYNGIDSNSVKFIGKEIALGEDLDKASKNSYNGNKDLDSVGSSFEGSNKSDDEIKLFYLGLVHKTKGVFDLLKVVDRVKDTDGFEGLSLTIVGDGPHFEKCKEYVKSRGLENKVSLLGKIKHNKALGMFCDFDIFVLPSRRVEGFPMTLVEAMFAGLPVIGSDMGGIPEAISVGKTGFVFESGNITELESKISLLVKDAKLRRSMGNNARERAQKEYTIQNMVDRYEKIMRKLVK